MNTEYRNMEETDPDANKLAIVENSRKHTK